MSHQVDIKVNILDGDSIHVSVPETATVLQLMEQIEQKTGIVETEQRLIYLGHSLSKEKKLEDYAIHDGVCIQLVKQVSREPVSPTEGEEMQTVQTSYVVYLPFRITETATVPVRSSRSSSAPTVSRDSTSVNQNSIPTFNRDSTSMNHNSIPTFNRDSTPSNHNSIPTFNRDSTPRNPPLEGAPPVPRYPQTSLVSTESESQFLHPGMEIREKLRDAADQLKEQGDAIEHTTEAFTLRSPLFHKTLHSFEKVVSALTDYYHTYQNEEGIVESVDDPALIHSVIDTLHSICTIVQANYHE